jgi:hypothetical protein
LAAAVALDNFTELTQTHIELVELCTVVQVDYTEQIKIRQVTPV